VPSLLAGSGRGGRERGGSAPVSLSPLLVASGWVSGELQPADRTARPGRPPASDSPRSTAQTRPPDEASLEGRPDEGRAPRGVAADIIGCDLDAVRDQNPSWRIEGAWPARGERACVVGASAARRAGLSVGGAAIVSIGRGGPPA